MGWLRVHYTLVLLTLSFLLPSKALLGSFPDFPGLIWQGRGTRSFSPAIFGQRIDSRDPDGIKRNSDCTLHTV